MHVIIQIIQYLNNQNIILYFLKSCYTRLGNEQRLNYELNIQVYNVLYYKTCYSLEKFLRAPMA